MAIPFDDANQYAIGSTSKSITTDTSIAFRWSEIVLAALRASGLFDTLIDDTTAPTDLAALWLDENTSPGSLKRWDATQTAWVPVTYDWFVNQASLSTVIPRIDALEEALTAARSVATGGTGATNAATARANLGVTPANLGISAFMQTVLDDAGAPEVHATLGTSTFAQGLLDDEDAATARATLGIPFEYIGNITITATTESDVIAIPPEFKSLYIEVRKFRPDTDNAGLAMRVGVNGAAGPFESGASAYASQSQAIATIADASSIGVRNFWFISPFTSDSADQSRRARSYLNLGGFNGGTDLVDGVMTSHSINSSPENVLSTSGLRLDATPGDYNAIQIFSVIGNGGGQSNILELEMQVYGYKHG